MDDSPEEVLAKYGIGDDSEGDVDALQSDLHTRVFEHYVRFQSDGKPATAQTRISCAYSWLSWCEDVGVEGDEVGSEHLYRYVDDIKARLSDASVGSRVDTVVMMHEWAEKRGHLPENPFNGFELEEEYSEISRNVPKQVRILKKRGSDDSFVSISAGMVQELVEHSGTPRARNQLVNRLLWQTGLRTVELANIKLDDVDTEERSIRVRTAKTDIGDDNDFRTVYYQENLEYPMWEWMEGGERESIYSGDKADPEYLLQTQQKRQMRPAYISRIVKDSAKRAGINEVLYVDAAGKNRWLVTGHTLRHSYASYCANEAEMPLHTLKRLMGHKSMDTTLQYVTDDDEVTKKHARAYGPR